MCDDTGNFFLVQGIDEPLGEAGAHEAAYDQDIAFMEPVVNILHIHDGCAFYDTLKPLFRYDRITGIHLFCIEKIPYGNFLKIVVKRIL